MSPERLSEYLRVRGFAVVGYENETTDHDAEVYLTNDHSVQIDIFNGEVEYTICFFDPTTNSVSFSNGYTDIGALVRDLKCRPLLPP